MTEKAKMSLYCDFGDLKAVNYYIKEGTQAREAELDLYLKRLPENTGYAVFSGLESVCEYLERMRYDESDIEFLGSTGEFGKELFDYLKDFRFSGTLKSVPEGSIVFAGEPIMTLRAPLAEVILVGAAIRQAVGSQSLVSTRASRMTVASHGLPVIDVGAHAAVSAARAAYIGGASATTCTPAAKLCDIPLASVMPHSFVQGCESEYGAFEGWIGGSAPTVLTLDTFDTLSSGIQSAVRAILRLREKQSADVAVRITSGDLPYLATRVREMLDRAGLEDVRIMASGGLDEYKIRALLRDGAPIDCFGVGEWIIYGGRFDVGYSLAALEEDGVMKPRIKLGDSARQTTLPGSKKLLRFFDKRTGKALVDEVCLDSERVPSSRHTVFDPTATWKTKELVNFEVRELLETVIENGVRVLPPRTLREIRDYHARELDTLCSDVRRLDSPESYYVDLSEKLWTLRRRMIGAKRSAFFVR